MQHDPKAQASTTERERDEFDLAERDPATGNYILQGPFGMTQSIPESEIERVRADRRAQADQRRIANATRLPFQLRRTCTKCGYGADEGDKPARVKFCRDAAQLAPHLGDGEVLVRECRRCEHAWAEKPLDAMAEGI